MTGGQTTKSRVASWTDARPKWGAQVPGRGRAACPLGLTVSFLKPSSCLFLNPTPWTSLFSFRRRENPSRGDKRSPNRSRQRRPQPVRVTRPALGPEPPRVSGEPGWGQLIRPRHSGCLQGLGSSRVTGFPSSGCKVSLLPAPARLPSVRTARFLSVTPLPCHVPGLGGVSGTTGRGLAVSWCPLEKRRTRAVACAPVPRQPRRACGGRVPLAGQASVPFSLPKATVSEKTEMRKLRHVALSAGSLFR